MENVAVLGFLFSYKQTCRQKSWSHTLGCAGQGVKKLAQLGLTGEAQGPLSPATPALGKRYWQPCPMPESRCLGHGIGRVHCWGKKRQAVSLPSPLQGRAAATRSLFMQRLKEKNAPL